jgi:hypothetical protein
MTLTDNLTELGRTALTALPPAFVVLVALNVAFLAVVMWFLEHQTAQRLDLVNKIVAKCLGSQ